VSDTPKIARMTISSVIRCIAGRVTTTCPAGQEAISASAAAVISSP